MKMNEDEVHKLRQTRECGCLRTSCGLADLSSTSELLLFPLGSLLYGFLPLLIELGVILVLFSSTIPGEIIG